MGSEFGQARTDVEAILVRTKRDVGEDGLHAIGQAIRVWRETGVWPPPREEAPTPLSLSWWPARLTHAGLLVDLLTDSDRGLNDEEIRELADLIVERTPDPLTQREPPAGTPRPEERPPHHY